MSSNVCILLQVSLRHVVPVRADLNVLPVILTEKLEELVDDLLRRPALVLRDLVAGQGQVLFQIDPAGRGDEGRGDLGQGQGPEDGQVRDIVAGGLAELGGGLADSPEKSGKPVVIY